MYTSVQIYSACVNTFSKLFPQQRDVMDTASLFTFMERTEAVISTVSSSHTRPRVGIKAPGFASHIPGSRTS